MFGAKVIDLLNERSEPFLWLIVKAYNGENGRISIWVESKCNGQEYFFFRLFCIASHECLSLCDPSYEELQGVCVTPSLRERSEALCGLNPVSDVVAEQRHQPHECIRG